MIKKKECRECGGEMIFSEDEQLWYCRDTFDCRNFEELSLGEQLDKLIIERTVIDEEIKELMKRIVDEEEPKNDDTK